MERISINNLFPSNNTFKPLDVYSLYNTKEQRIKNKINFSIDRLINLREERKKKILEQYDKVFNICLNKINTANNLNKTETIYEVPNGIYGFIDYKPLECVHYIQKKLHDMCLNTLILSENVLYISWTYLEENIKNKK